MRYPGILLGYWHILLRIIMILCLRGPHIANLATGISSPVWGNTACSSPSYMVSASRQNFYFQITNARSEVRNSGLHFNITRVRIDTWRWIWIVHWLEWVIIPLLLVMPNLYSILGSKFVKGIPACCTCFHHWRSLAHLHCMNIRDSVYSI